MGFQEFKQKYNISLNAQQEAAVQTVNGAVLLLAVPGSGKTTVLITRLGYLICEAGIAPENILTVTYTVAAARDMQKRFAEKFGEALAKRLEFRTINSLSQKILSYYGSRIGREVHRIMENKEKLALIKNIFRNINNAFATEGDVRQAETAITFVKNMRLGKEELENRRWDVDNFPEIYAAYQQELKRLRRMDFDDQMVYALRLLERVPEVLGYYQAQYRYICVDEAQDTSRLQHDMLNLLAQKSGNLFMVGDEDQSIYGFRAAYPEALTSFEKVHPDAKILLMESNYRSAQEIVAAADKLIQANQERHEKHMKAVRPVGGRVRQIEAKSRKAQFSYLRKVAEGCTGETAVLYRNNESVLPLLDLLDRSRIPYRVKGREITYFTHPVVTDICNFIRLAQNPGDAEAFCSIYYKMGAGISKANVSFVTSRKNGTSLLEAVAALPDISDFTRDKCMALAREFEELREDSAGQAVRRILDEMGYRAYMNEHEMDANKAEILQLLANGEEKPENLISRLEYLRNLIAEGAQDSDANFILSTIHSSKGLEYDTVYLLDMLEGILPAMPEPDGSSVPGGRNVPGGRGISGGSAAEYEEERRLYYVGMTRARNQLYIFTFRGDSTSAFSREVFGIRRKSAPQASAKDIVSSGAQKYADALKTSDTYYRRPAKPQGSAKEKETAVNLEDYEQGVIVIHKKFGVGAVVERTGNVAAIAFANPDEIKTVRLDFAVAKGLLRLK